MEASNVMNRNTKAVQRLHARKAVIGYMESQSQGEAHYTDLYWAVIDSISGVTQAEKLTMATKAIEYCAKREQIHVTDKTVWLAGA